MSTTTTTTTTTSSIRQHPPTTQSSSLNTHIHPSTGNNTTAAIRQVRRTSRQTTSETSTAAAAAAKNTNTGDSQVLTLRWYVGGAVTVDATWLAFHPLSPSLLQGTTTSTSTGTTTNGKDNGVEGKNEGATAIPSSSSSSVTKEQAVAALVSSSYERGKGVHTQSTFSLPTPISLSPNNRTLWHNLIGLFVLFYFVFFV